MKKLKILIPSLVCMEASLPICLTSCKSEYQNYQVSNDDFESIVSMEGVEYLQYMQYIVQGKTSTFMQYEISPTVYHLNMFSDDPDMNCESYGYIENNNYWKIYRMHATSAWTEPMQIEQESFYTPQKIAESIKFHYNHALDCGAIIDFNKEDLNYQTHYSCTSGTTLETIDTQWSFYKNQLQSFSYKIVDQLSGAVIRTERNHFVDFKYEQYTPVLPL